MNRSTIARASLACSLVTPSVRSEYADIVISAALASAFDTGRAEGNDDPLVEGISASQPQTEPLQGTHKPESGCGCRWVNYPKLARDLSVQKETPGDQREAPDTANRLPVAILRQWTFTSLSSGMAHQNRCLTALR